MTLKADESADCAGSCKICFGTGLFFSFFWGIKIVNALTQTRISAGQD
jgi:hypothetical protein